MSKPKSSTVVRRHSQSVRPGKKFEKFRAENFAELADEVYDRLWKVIQELGQRKGKDYSDFLSPEQGQITLKFLAGENVFGVIPTS